MNHTTVINKISELGYKGFKEAYLRQMEDVNYHNLSFEDRVYQLLDAQDTFLNNRRTQMNLKLSKIKNKQALIENIDYDPKREINKAQILSLASMDFIRAHQNIIINGLLLRAEKGVDYIESFWTEKVPADVKSKMDVGFLEMRHMMKHIK